MMDEQAMGAILRAAFDGCRAVAVSGEGAFTRTIELASGDLPTFTLPHEPWPEFVDHWNLHGDLARVSPDITWEDSGRVLDAIYAVMREQDSEEG